jgi:hypothetical protein
MMMDNNILSTTTILFGIIVLSLYILLIMIIWNNVIIKKFPQQNIQKLSFWDALALSIFFSLLSGGCVRHL